MQPDLRSVGDLIIELREVQAEATRLSKIIDGGHMLIMGCLERIGGEIVLGPSDLERICSTYYLQSTPQNGGLWIRLYHREGK